MNKPKMTYVSTLALVAAAGTASATDGPRDYRGSDTLEVLTQELVLECAAIGGGTAYPRIDNFVYVGGGSTTGENAMSPQGTQDIAPMSRALDNSACATSIPAAPGSGGLPPVDGEPPIVTSGAGADAEGLVVALDGLSVLASSNTTSQICADGGPSANLVSSRTIDVRAGGTGAVVGTYTFGNVTGTGTGTAVNPFVDMLRIVYAGADNDDGNAQNLANRATRCNSDLRRTVVADWKNLLQEGDTCADASCGAVTRAIRRGDLSGTTDTFGTFLALGAIRTSPSNADVVIDGPYCNGLDYQDLDPIRTPCSADDDVCGRNGTSGLVQPILVPENQDTALGYPSTACSPGSFQFLPNPRDPATGSIINSCLDGGIVLVGRCLTPTISGSLNRACLSAANNVNIFSPPGTDGRVFNQWVRLPPPYAGNASGMLTDQAGQDVVYGYYRQRSRTEQCEQQSSTLQIGCLVEENDCSLGFAGLEGGVDIPGTELAQPMQVGNIFPTETTVQALVLDPPNQYPFARKLYINSIVGFDNIRAEAGETQADSEQRQLFECATSEPAALAAAVGAANFVEVPGGAFIEAFNNASCP